VIALDLHTPATPVTKLAAAKLVIDYVLVYGHSRRQPLDNRDQRSSV
jgi:hypothetical protein